MGIHTAVGRAERAGRQAKDHPFLDALVRGGFLAYGIVYLLLAWLAAQLAFGDREGKVSKDGALDQLAAQPWGNVVLWAAAAGFAALVVWQALTAWVGHRSKQGAQRILARTGSAARMVLYGVLGVSAAKVAVGSKTKENPDRYTAELMSMPLGPWLVGGIGLGILGYAVGSVVKGVTDRYRDDLDLDGRTGRTGRLVAVLARIGYVSRGVAFGIVGGLFVWAAATHDADKSGGLDAALSKLLQAPLGPYLLAIVAIGLGCYGLFNVARARHHDG